MEGLKAESTGKLVHFSVEKSVFFYCKISISHQSQFLIRLLSLELNQKEILFSRELRLIVFLPQVRDLIPLGFTPLSRISLSRAGLEPALSTITELFSTLIKRASPHPTYRQDFEGWDLFSKNLLYCIKFEMVRYIELFFI